MYKGILIKCLKALRKIYRTSVKPDLTKRYIFNRTDDFVKKSGQEASDLIKKMIEDDKPLMIARFGEIEMRCLTNVYFVKSNLSYFKKIFSYITYKSTSFWWDEYSFKTMPNNAGFFPASTSNFLKFYDLMFNCMKNVDILGSWLGQEKLFEEQLKEAEKIRFRDLEPYYHESPWSSALKGKKVLVVHPFAESIQRQYRKRNVLFKNKDILPDFELITYKSVQSIAGNKTQFNDWFEALEYMENQISDIDFDVAIIGNGAYGFPLASFVKNMGKKAIHLGGPTQVMFGIIGKRWEEHPLISKFINSNWVRPLDEEKPAHISEVENGCYW